MLQVLQDTKFYRLGSHEPLAVDVRVMAASHCDFEKAIESKSFGRISITASTSSTEDTAAARKAKRNSSRFRSLLAKACDCQLAETRDRTRSLRQVLLEYNWPGNVRELENVMRKYLVMRSASVLAGEIRQKTVKSKTVYVPTEGLIPRRRASDWEGLRPEFAEVPVPVAQRPASVQELTLVQELPRPSLVPRPSNRLPSENLSTLSGVNDARKRAEADAILRALDSSRWNRKRAAAMLNVDYKSLLYKMKKLGIGEKSTVAYG